MPADHQMAQPGFLHWNRGGWFGGLAGGTAWLLIGAIMLAPQAPALAAIWLAGFILINVVGILLWRQRALVRPHTAIQVLLFLCGVTGVLGWLTLNTLRPELVNTFGGPVRGYWAFLIFPALMAWFAIMEYASRNGSRPPGSVEPGIAPGQPRG
jgi:hypothetical protein